MWVLLVPGNDTMSVLFSSFVLFLLPMLGGFGFMKMHNYGYMYRLPPSLLF